MHSLLDEEKGERAASRGEQARQPASKRRKLEFTLSQRLTRLCPSAEVGEPNGETQ